MADNVLKLKIISSLYVEIKPMAVSTLAPILRFTTFINLLFCNVLLTWFQSQLVKVPRA